MTHTTVRPGTWSTSACGVVLASAAVLSAAPASADQLDDAFVSALTNYGITVPDRDDAIAKARSVCGEFDRHQSSSLVAMKLMRDTNLTANQAGYFVGAAVSAYCPQYRGATDPSAIWLLPPFPFPAQ